MMKTRVEITYDQFRRIAVRDAGTLSKTARPGADKTAYTYKCTFGEFVASDVYPVKFVNTERTILLDYKDSGAKPIHLDELSRLPDLVRKIMSSWHPEGGTITKASFITLYCTGCERRVLIDGVHRALWLATHDGQKVPVHVTELAGSQWPTNTPDLNVVCVCARA